MHPIFIISTLLVIITAFLCILIIEYIVHNKRLNKIPVRISVTGTRGKTSVTRLAASMLRESGMRVLAKTTGTEPKYVFPDGSEHLIKRIGKANIMEQKRLVKLGAKLKVDCLISEIMSIHQENHQVESQKLIKPQHTIITNFLPDHLDGTDNTDMISLYSRDIVKGSNIYTSVGEHVGELKMTLKNQFAAIHVIDGSDFADLNQKLAGELAQKLGCSEDAINKGIEKTQMDRGELKAWRITSKSDIEAILINSFAANDPASATEIIRIIYNKKEFSTYKRIGILNLRKDRGDRSHQWLDFLKGEGSDIFDDLYVMGLHSHAFVRNLGKGNIIKSKNSQEITKMIIDRCKEKTLVFGMVNIRGIGMEMIDYWEKHGTNIEL